jgi:glucose-6-phosphate isomerase
MFNDGMSIVDKHCQETTLDRNVCVQMALLRIWTNICERKAIAIITCDDELEHFGTMQIFDI